jgi:hypothetical protein
MRVSSRLFRASVWLASTSLSLATALPAYAQPAAPGPAQTEDSGQQGPQDAGSQGGDPPAIAGRVSDMSGTVSFHAAGDTNWAAASLNYPVTNGDGFWTEPSAHAALQFGDDTVVLAGSTEFEISALDVQQVTATEAQGATFLAIQSLPNGQKLTVNTPRGAVEIAAPGRYEVVAGDTNDATTVTVVEGAAHVEGTGVSLDIGPQQTATIGGSETFQGTVGAMQEDQFLRTELEQAKQVQQRVSQLPQQVQYMTGGTALAQYGSFESSEQYGQVWYPRDVPADWAPYREGHWAYVAPWGWNWVDNAPWGFAPFHYGRWVQYGGRWGWCAGAPGVVYGGGYPVYSPALVGFVGLGGAVLAGAAFGLGAGFFGHGGGIGWVPLGFNEPYYPPYHVSEGYFRNINRFSVTNIRNYNITNIRNVSYEHSANARFATVMPESAMVRGEGGRQFARPLPAAALAQGRPVFGRPPVTPTAETPNLSRRAAEEYHLPVQRAAAHAGPGPAIRPEGEAGRRPALRAAEPPRNVHAVPAASVVGHGPAGVRPGEIGRPGAGPEHAGLPALRQPGAGRPATAPIDTRREGGPGEAARPGEVGRPGEAGRPGAAARPGEAVRPGEVARPGEAARPGEGARPGEVTRPGEAGRAGGMPGLRGPGAAPPGVEHRQEGPARAPEAHAPTRPEAARPETARPEPGREPARPETHAQPAPRAESRPAEHAAPVRQEPARAEPARHEAAPRPEARPVEQRHEAAPRPEAPRPAEVHREAAPRPAAAPHPAPHPEAPRPAEHHDNKK